MSSTSLSVTKLSTESLPHFLKFFDGGAFSDNPKWS